MKEPMLPTVANLEGWRGFSPCLEAIVAMQPPIREAAFAFDSLYGRDDLRAAQCLAIVQVAVFTDLVAKVRQSMRPFVRLNHEVYSYLDDEIEDEDAIPGIESGTQESPSETKLPRWSDSEALGGFAYHICGVIDALDDVREAADAFVAKCGIEDDDGAAALLARLQVELFFHLAYHIKELMHYLVDLNRKVYTKLHEELRSAERWQVE